MLGVLVVVDVVVIYGFLFNLVIFGFILGIVV